ncbi:SAP domain-containing protein [Nodularia sp. NIES-3585]|uniref:SAP domain-containing protein n=1 Tax=Nodularia sp. NIES-3585 TaxID=1973477 RepID=UPI000B5C7E43|nr:SAP domain-containing protein [Nodularia sp. NIES-3585]GAX36439.1 hypothetical protein NIES3585_24710 [Nodularia sp. NIES-3585]
MNFTSLTYNKLQAECKLRGLSAKSKTVELIARLNEYEELEKNNLDAAIDNIISNVKLSMLSKILGLDVTTEETLAIHLVKLDGTQVEIGIEEVKKYTDEYFMLDIRVSECGDKIVFYDHWNSFEFIPVNEIATTLITKKLSIDVVCGDAIVISLV